MPDLSLEEELSLVPIETISPEAKPESSTAQPDGSDCSRQRAIFGSCGSRLVRASETDRPTPRGPGWFDSSWDLRRGCEVREGWPGDSHLRDWIECWLYAAGGAGAPGGVGASLSAT